MTNMETKKCLTCGTEMDVNAINCPNCGAIKGRKKPMPNTHMGWAIFTTIFCCIVTGIISIVYAAKVSKLYKQGDIVGAYQKSKLADRWANIGVLIFFLPIIVYIIASVSGASLGAYGQLFDSILSAIGIK